MDIPPAPPFLLPQDRSRVTHEPEERGKWTPLFPDALGQHQFGGGAVPESFTWPSNPKEWQEELSNGELLREAEANGALGTAGELPALIPASVLPALPPGTLAQS
ncbi:MAG: hypothetical protein ACLQDQ_07200 [Myxococcaceae bacterium]